MMCAVSDENYKGIETVAAPDPSMAAAKAAGKVRMEGKDYLMKDGDVVEFRFNV